MSHGGAGVLHSTLRAGIPAVIAPLMGDQFAWARLVDARYLGVLPAKAKRVSPCFPVEVVPL